MRGSIDIIVKGIGNASNFYGPAGHVLSELRYAPAVQWAGSIIRAARRSWSTLDATALSSLPLNSLQIVWCCRSNLACREAVIRGRCLFEVS